MGGKRDEKPKKKEGKKYFLSEVEKQKSRENGTSSGFGSWSEGNRNAPSTSSGSVSVSRPSINANAKSEQGTNQFPVLPRALSVELPSFGLTACKSGSDLYRPSANIITATATDSAQSSRNRLPESSFPDPFGLSASSRSHWNSFGDYDNTRQCSSGGSCGTNQTQSSLGNIPPSGYPNPFGPSSWNSQPESTRPIAPSPCPTVRNQLPPCQCTHDVLHPKFFHSYTTNANAAPSSSASGNCKCTFDPLHPSFFHSSGFNGVPSGSASGNCKCTFDPLHPSFFHSHSSRFNAVASASGDGNREVDSSGSEAEDENEKEDDGITAEKEKADKDGGSSASKKGKYN